MSERIGFYICHCGINISYRVRVKEVAEYVATLPNIVVSRDYLFMCSDPGQELIEKDIREHNLTRVVVSSCSPRMHERTFRGACERAGLNPFRAFHMVCVREHVSWVTLDEDEATEKAKALVRAGVTRVTHQEDLYPQSFPVNSNTLVVGGGIAGMQASLDIAKAGFKVYLVEKQATVGGHMLQYDKTFPTLDCAACIGTPKMVSVGQESRIELLTHSEVEEVSGFVGNFKVRVRKRARYVETNCTGCGECEKACPVTVPNEWDVHTKLRKAIYRPFPQAVPITYLIDKVDRAPCGQTCPAGTNVQGYVALVKEGRPTEATRIIMEKLPLPHTLGRVCPAPCEAECRRAEVDSPISIRNIKRYAADHAEWDLLAKDDIEAKEAKIAVVGAGPAGLSCAYFLAEEGYGVTIFEAAPVAGGMLRLGIPDYRLPPATLQLEIDFIKAMNVEIICDHPIGEGGKNTIEGLLSDGFSAVFVGIGAQRSVNLGIPGEDNPRVLHGVEFLYEANLGRKLNIGKKIVVIGGGAVAADVARVALRNGAQKVEMYCLEQHDEMPAWEDDIRALKDEGIVINNGWGPKEFTATGALFKSCTRVFNEQGRFSPTYDESNIRNTDCDNVIMAVGQTVDAKSLGVTLTPRGTIDIDAKTMETNVAGVFAGGDGATGPRIVVDAVAQGHEGAISILRYLNGEDLRENRPDKPTGTDWAPIPTWATAEPRAEMPELEVSQRAGNFNEIELGFSDTEAQREAARCIACGVCSECKLCVDACEAKAVNHSMEDEVVEIDVGSIIVATGFDPLDPTPMHQYGYGRLNNVITNLEFERLSNATGPTSGKLLLSDPNDEYGFTRAPKSVAILHCIGSRDINYHEYCSRACCMYALKYAHLLKDKCGHDTQVYNFYIDMRCFGKGYEEFYKRVQAEGVHMIRGKASRVIEEDGMLVVRAEDTLSNRLVEVPVEMVILCTAMEPREDTPDVARIFGLTVGSDGFLLEEHPKLEPVSTATSGVFIAGACQGPKDIPDTVAQAKGAAAEALALSAFGKVSVSPMISSIDPDICVGCKACIGLCAYSAIEFNDFKGISEVNSAVCKGCGSCGGHCPSGAASIRHFTEPQIFAEIDGLLGAK
ncbi:MAG: FAD-dependent oxidoreductase [Proteobacteria bacterium]|jgi:heterodisulfide reductase subunit A2|nr:FAD-dependent oxidoreductase [Pseudomonadota bacterium]